MKSKRVRALGQLHDDGIFPAFVGVILAQFQTQTSRLHSDGRVALRIESARPTQHLSGNLIFLKRHPRMIKRVFCQITEQLAQRFRPAQAMAFNKRIYLLEALLPSRCETVCQCHVTER